MSAEGACDGCGTTLRDLYTVWAQDEPNDGPWTLCPDCVRERRAVFNPPPCPCGCAGKIADHDERGYGPWACPECGDDSDTDKGRLCSLCAKAHGAEPLDPDDFTCPACGHASEPGTFLCAGCAEKATNHTGGPFG